AMTGVESVRSRFDRLVEKGRMTTDERDAAANRLHAAGSAADLTECDLVIEAIIESLQAKTAVLNELLPHLKDDAIIASNTSSLSISAIGEAIGQPKRVVGMHFFNPAPLMPLVEVIQGRKSDAKLVQ